jgi:hypothetical protein
VREEIVQKERYTFASKERCLPPSFAKERDLSPAAVKKEKKRRIRR